MQNVHYFIHVFGWVGCKMGGILVFHHFHVLLLLIFLYQCNSVNNVGGQHRWLFAFLAACYELASVLFLCFSCLIALLFVANTFSSSSKHRNGAVSLTAVSPAAANCRGTGERSRSALPLPSSHFSPSSPHSSLLSLLFHPLIFPFLRSRPLRIS